MAKRKYNLQADVYKKKLQETVDLVENEYQNAGVKRAIYVLVFQVKRNNAFIIVNFAGYFSVSFFADSLFFRHIFVGHSQHYFLKRIWQYFNKQYTVLIESQLLPSIAYPMSHEV